MQRYIFVFLLSLCLVSVGFLTGCDIIDYHPYESKVSGPTGLIAQNLNRMKAASPAADTFRFAFFSDTQRHYDETKDLVTALNARDDLAFALHGGDITDFGLTDEYEWIRDLLVKIRIPWFCVLGNHDTLGNGEHIYRQVFGDFNYSFTYGHVRFECLNTNALEFDNSDKVPDFDFLRDELQEITTINTQHPDSITRTIFLMHSRPDDEQFNANIEEYFQYVIRQFPGMIDGSGFCLNGHNHSNCVMEPFGDGVLYYQVADISERCYYLFTIHSSGEYQYETVNF